MTELTDDQVRALAHRYRFAKDDHERTIAQTARALLDARSDTEAAVALALEEAAEVVKALWKWDDEGCQVERVSARQATASIRALAPSSGVARLAALRAEIADLSLNMDADLKTMVREGEQLRTLAAENASLKVREEGVAMALKEFRATFCHASPGSDTEFALFLEGFDAAADIARAALAQTPTDPGDGWTWNERLGWIGPDGKPADPRRRG